MSTWEPLTPDRHHPDDEIAAADPGAGAPPPAEGFGVAGEEPDRPEEATAETTPAETVPAEDSPAAGARSRDVPFRTPDPADVRRA